MSRGAESARSRARPPRLAEWLLARLLVCDGREALLGDLAEEYAARRRRGNSPARTYFWYWKQLAASLAPSRRQQVELKRARPPRYGRSFPMDVFSQDLRHVLRSLRGSPGFVFATVATTILGLGVATVMFTVVYSVTSRPLPYEDARRLVVVVKGEVGDTNPTMPSSYASYEFFQDNARAFQELAAYNRGTSITLRLGENPESVPAARVSANFFSTLGVEPSLGRDFRPEEDEVGAETVLILSHEVWASRFGADPDVVGRRVRLARSEGTIIGVMPAGFRDIHDRPRIWTSMATQTRLVNTNNVYMVGRLAEGVTAELAAEDIERVRAELVAADPEFHYAAGFVRSLRDWRVGDVRPFLRIAGAAVVLIVLIVIANLSNLCLVRLTNRSKELAVRTAIGAGRLQIVRLLLVEALLLGLAGTAAALVLAHHATEIFLSASPSSVPRQAEIVIDTPVLVFAALGGIIVSVAANLLALAAGTSRGRSGSLVPGGRAADVGRSGRRAQRALAVAQLSLALALLVAVGLLLRSLDSMQAVDMGLTADGALVVEVEAPLVAEPGTPSPEATTTARRAFYKELLTEIRALPGVEAAGGISLMPLTGWTNTAIVVEGLETPADEPFRADVDTATPGFFAAMGIELLSGRPFLDSDTADSTKVALVSRAMAESYWPGQDPLGRRFRDEDSDGGLVELTVIGVVDDVRSRGVGVDPGPKFYTAYAQSGYWWPFGMFVALRSSTPPEGHAQPIRNILRQTASEPPLVTLTTLHDWLGTEFASIRFQTSLFAVFALVAAMLAGVGLYGVIASGVARQTREIGVRMALGANAARVLRQVITSGARLGVVGTLAGTPLALMLARSMGSMLFGVSAIDPPTFLATILVLNAICIAACWVPAKRASRVAPLEAMRE